MNKFRTKRLIIGDQEFARKMFAVMSEVFENEYEELSEDYINFLLNRKDFWSIAAFLDEDIVGGITAHTLPMTRSESSEVFVYDLAVRSDYQRRGIGRKLITALREEAAAVGIDEVFVGADNDDVHALDFYRAVGGLETPVTFFTFSYSKNQC